ncbi:MAG: hypothetical protein IKF17_03490 [Clostridia bacterium]|nr:hypothetical protein [Clostridia bacterium]
MAERGSENIKRKPVEPGKIELEAVSIATIINENEKNELVSNNSDTVQSMEIMSPELHEGMVIAVHDGGKPENVQDR